MTEELIAYVSSVTGYDAEVVRDVLRVSTCPCCRQLLAAAPEYWPYCAPCGREVEE